MKALPRQWVALDTAILQSLRSRMFKAVSPFFLISLLMVSMYFNCGLPWVSYLLPPCPALFFNQYLLLVSNTTSHCDHSQLWTLFYVSTCNFSCDHQLPLVTDMFLPAGFVAAVAWSITLSHSLGRRTSLLIGNQRPFTSATKPHTRR